MEQELSYEDSIPSIVQLFQERLQKCSYCTACTELQYLLATSSALLMKSCYKFYSFPCCYRMNPQKREKKCLRTETDDILHSRCFYREKLNLCKMYVLATEEQVGLLSGLGFFFNFIKQNSQKMQFQEHFILQIVSVTYTCEKTPTKLTACMFYGTGMTIYSIMTSYIYETCIIFSIW